MQSIAKSPVSNVIPGPILECKYKHWAVLPGVVFLDGRGFFREVVFWGGRGFFRGGGGFFGEGDGLGAWGAWFFWGCGFFQGGMAFFSGGMVFGFFRVHRIK